MFIALLCSQSKVKFFFHHDIFDHLYTYLPSFSHFNDGDLDMYVAFFVFWVREALHAKAICPQNTVNGTVANARFLVLLTTGSLICFIPVVISFFIQ